MKLLLAALLTRTCPTGHAEHCLAAGLAGHVCALGIRMPRINNSAAVGAQIHSRQAANLQVSAMSQGEIQHR